MTYEEAILTGKWGFDYDGVLSEKPLVPAKKWGQMRKMERVERTQSLIAQHFRATPLYDPPQREFYVITARKNSPEVRAVSLSWLNQRFGQRMVKAAFLQSSRTIENVVVHKSSCINHWQLTDFVEDNVKVLAGIQKNCPKTRLWFFEKGLTQPVPFTLRR
jgi:hypothetical protein